MIEEELKTLIKKILIGKSRIETSRFYILFAMGWLILSQVQKDESILYIWASAMCIICLCLALREVLKK